MPPHVPGHDTEPHMVPTASKHRAPLTWHSCSQFVLDWHTDTTVPPHQGRAAPWLRQSSGGQQWGHSPGPGSLLLSRTPHSSMITSAWNLGCTTMVYLKACLPHLFHLHRQHFYLLTNKSPVQSFPTTGQSWDISSFPEHLP